MILVVGGGPAGCAASHTLAVLGHRVRLVTRPAPASARLAVSIPPSGGKAFEAIGVRAAIDAAGFVRTAGNTVWWGDGQTRVEPFAGGDRGWQVEIGALEEVLLEASAGVGVEIERRSLDHRNAAGHQDDFILDCTGRAGVLARTVGRRTYEQQMRSVALVGVWEREGGWQVADDTHTWIESYVDGWAWSIPVAPGRRHVAAMVDPRSSALVRGASALGTYHAELAKAPRFASLLRDAVLRDGPWGWDASMYWSEQYVHGRMLLVGDAGSFVDPLSAAGVRKALVSGWTAAVAVHTSVARPAMRETALAYFEARERRMYAALRRLARSHLAEAATGHEAPFWDERHFAIDERDAAMDEAISADDAPRVREAFERIRQAPALRLRPGLMGVEPRPAIRGHEVVLEPRIVAPDVPEGVRFVRGVDVLLLVEMAPSHVQVPHLFERYCRYIGPVDLGALLAALATAVAHGWLVMGPE